MFVFRLRTFICLGSLMDCRDKCRFFHFPTLLFLLFSRRKIAMHAKIDVLNMLLVYFYLIPGNDTCPNLIVPSLLSFLSFFVFLSLFLLLFFLPLFLSFFPVLLKWFSTAEWMLQNGVTFTLVKLILVLVSVMSQKALLFFRRIKVLHKVCVINM